MASRLKSIAASSAFAVAVALGCGFGCRGTGEVEYAGEVHVTSPDLVEIRPGVQVVADADEPIFYSHSQYWLYRDGFWMRSNDTRRGFARVEYTYVPDEVRVIERPHLYVKYRRNMGRERAARTPNMRTRSQRPSEPHEPPPVQRTQPKQPAPPTYPPPAPSQPAYPHKQTTPATSPTSPVYQPHQPHKPGVDRAGSDPTVPTPPPGPSSTTMTPNDHRREPSPQRAAPPEIDRTKSSEHPDR